MSENLPMQADKYENLRPILESVTALTPSLKDKLTTAAVSAFMRLPDSSFGWTEKNSAMTVEMKALAVIACLRYGLMPGTGQVYYLGNKLFISAEGKRGIAGKSHDFKWLSRKIRPLTSEEKELLFFEDGDRGLGIDAEIMVRGEKLNVTGLAIVEKSAIEWRNGSGFSKPGLGSKKDIYQTLVTRAESDIYKHYLPLEGMETDDGSNRDEQPLTLPAGMTINTTALNPPTDDTRKKRCEAAFEAIFIARQDMTKERFKELTGYGVNELAECTDPDRLENIALMLQEEKKTSLRNSVVTEAKTEPEAPPAEARRPGRPTKAQRLERIRKEFLSQCDRVQAAGGKPEILLHASRQEICESEDYEEILDAANMLKAWEPTATAPEDLGEDENDDEIDTEQPTFEPLDENNEVIETPQPQASADHPAYRLIGRYLEKPWITGAIAEALEKLQTLRLFPDDEAKIAVGVNKARDFQDLSELNELIALRS